MTAKDYRVLARALRDAKPVPSQGDDAMDVWVDICASITATLSTDNQLFDDALFLEAAGWEIQ